MSPRSCDLVCLVARLCSSQHSGLLGSTTSGTSARCVWVSFPVAGVDACVFSPQINMSEGVRNFVRRILSFDITTLDSG